MESLASTFLFLFSREPGVSQEQHHYAPLHGIMILSWGMRLVATWCCLSDADARYRANMSVLHKHSTGKSPAPMGCLRARVGAGCRPRSPRGDSIGRTPAWKPLVQVCCPV